MIWEFHISGVQHHKGRQIETSIPSGTELILEPEPDNDYDENAVKIKLRESDHVETMLGYVPGKLSKEISEAMHLGSVVCKLISHNLELKPWKRFLVMIETE